MKKTLFFLIALMSLSAIKAADLNDTDYRIIIPRHDWTEYMGLDKYNGNVKIPNGSIINNAGTDKSIFLQSAVVGNKIFTLMSSGYESNYPNKTSQGYFFEQGNQGMWYGGNSLTTFPFESTGEWYYMGPAVAADDAGNLWVATRRTDLYVSVPENKYGWAQNIGSVAYYTPENNPSLNPNAIGQGVKFEYQKDGKTVNATISERTDIMSAYGDGVNGTGHLWFTPQFQCFVECIIMKNGAVVNKKAFLLPEGEFSSHRGYINQFAPGKVLYLTGGQNTVGKIYLGTLDGATVENSTKITWEDTELNYCRNGATAFILHGHVVIAYSDLPGGNKSYYTKNASNTKAKEAITPKITPKASYQNGVTPAAYAYELKASKNDGSYTLSFRSTATASKATISLKNSDTGVSYDFEISPVVMGVNSYTVEASDLIQGNYDWSVSIANAANSTSQKYYDQGGTANDKRGGVAIDLDTESPYYGYI